MKRQITQSYTHNNVTVHYTATVESVYAYNGEYAKSIVERAISGATKIYDDITSKDTATEFDSILASYKEIHKELSPYDNLNVDDFFLKSAIEHLNSFKVKEELICYIAEHLVGHLDITICEV